MDPDVARRRLVQLSERLVQGDPEDQEWAALQASATELAETFLGLDEWLKKQGFLPSAWNPVSHLLSRRVVQDAVLASTARSIHREMDGKDWSPSTLDAIADHLRRAGFEIREPGTDEVVP